MKMYLGGWVYVVGFSLEMMCQMMKLRWFIESCSYDANMYTLTSLLHLRYIGSVIIGPYKIAQTVKSCGVTARVTTITKMVTNIK